MDWVFEKVRRLGGIFDAEDIKKSWDMSRKKSRSRSEDDRLESDSQKRQLPWQRKGGPDWDILGLHKLEGWFRRRGPWRGC